VEVPFNLGTQILYATIGCPGFLVQLLNQNRRGVVLGTESAVRVEGGRVALFTLSRSGGAGFGGCET